MTEHKRKMSEDEAIYCLKAESERYPQVCEECTLYGETGCDHCYDDANDVAIKALEKQIPKRLKHDVCPNCDTNNDMIIKHLGNPQAHKVVYCWNCGQKLDWGNEDDKKL